MPCTRGEEGGKIGTCVGLETLASTLTDGGIVDKASCCSKDGRTPSVEVVGGERGGCVGGDVDDKGNEDKECR